MSWISQMWSNPFGRIGIGLINGGIVGATGGTISGYGFDSTTLRVPIPPASIVYSSSIAGSIFGATICLFGPNYLQETSCGSTCIKTMAIAASHFGSEAIGWIITQKIGYDISFLSSIANSAMSNLIGLGVVGSIAFVGVTIYCCREKKSDLETPLNPTTPP